MTDDVATHGFFSAGIDPRTGLMRGVRLVLLAAAVIGFLHHVDHVLRVDHSGWPFIATVTPFTYSLVAYPVLAFALLGPRRFYWLRWALLALGTVFTLYAHTQVESPQMQYAMWAYDRSLEPRLWNVRNLCSAQSGTMGIVSVIVSMTLNVLLTAGTIGMLVDGLRHRASKAHPAG